jgi:hypothetical protein
MSIGAFGREAPVTISATRLVLVLLHNLRYQTLYVYLGLRDKKNLGNFVLMHPLVLVYYFLKKIFKASGIQGFFSLNKFLKKYNANHLVVKPIFFSLENLRTPRALNLFK